MALFDAYEPTEQPNFTLTRSAPQSLAFAKEMLPRVTAMVDAFLNDSPDATEVTLADVGGGIGAGTEFIRAQLSIHLARTRPRPVSVRVTMIENAPEYAEWCRRFYPGVDFMCADIYEHTVTYDFVLSSHVIEHVDAPIEFVARMRRMAREKLLVYAPYNERPLKAYGHVNTIDDALIAKLDSPTVTLVRSKAWRGGCVFLEFRGNAT